jgi:hypothetical protein
MKKLFSLTGFILLAMLTAVGAFAQDDEAPSPLAAPSAGDDEQFFLLFSEGAACSWLTRIIKQTGRSNFVFDDFLPGLYFRMDLHTTKNITPMARVAVLYPLASTFNQFPQLPKTPLHFGVDMNLGVNFNILEFEYFRLNAGPALHLFFLNSDRWNYFDLGAAAFVGMELPITQNWTLICNGFASIDDGNLGGNRNMEPIDITYQYQIDIGVRYSKKLKNRTSLFPGNKQAQEAPIFSR